ncbi:MAG: transporter ATP-binding protein [Herbinix sp.]|jgi:putative ABC transport system ATP-binding protein|nr:transporter ATP-binding protein [Herbinix sp.]
MNAILQTERIEKYYGNKNNVTKALDDISFSVYQGEFIGVMGASGSGKTTLLNVISTIDTVSAGHIYLDGEDVTEISEKNLAKFRREKLGFVFQDFNLLDTLTLEENISYALTINKFPSADIPGKVKQVADKLGIGDILHKYPNEVSGGQKQRCACARAIINNPSIILADEPTGALDSKSAQLLMETLIHMNENMKATILMVTHDAFSASYAKKILFLKDGRIFSEIIRGDKTRKQFFGEILDVMTLLGGDLRDVR